MIKVFLNINPPTTTAQMRKVRVIHGKPMFYKPPKVREACRVLTEALAPYAPESPLEGAISLTAHWYFLCGRSHKDGEYRITRPDTDNIEKMLKDCMTSLNYWHDDAQVVCEHVEKYWAKQPGIYICVDVLDP
ncbi:MAG: RusA family crossover junction endodeoxyribonuclease [Lachnospiraceae bacterium]|nr:RusA family crossover junction endodeoxyribonuclease [Lachnospiraceae bacterium]